MLDIILWWWIVFYFIILKEFPYQETLIYLRVDYFGSSQYKYI